MPCWELTATDQGRKKLKSGHSKYQAEYTATGLRAQHVYIGALMTVIQHYTTEKIPIFDETGIKNFIDIDFTAAMINIEDVRKALFKQGLMLEKRSRPMKVLIIRDTNL
jgi:hypothetical protein